jgi:hypothetical protein
MAHKAIAVMVTLLLLLLTSARADACDCSPSKPLSSAVRTDYPFVFEGKVVVYRILHPMLTSGSVSSDTQDVQKVVFDVRRAWNGVTTKRIALSTVVSDCMFWFEIDHTYVVFAWKDAKGNPTTLHCSWTVESSKAAEVLAHLGQATVPK